MGASRLTLRCAAAAAASAAHRAALAVRHGHRLHIEQVHALWLVRAASKALAAHLDRLDDPCHLRPATAVGVSVSACAYA
eukprot:5049492-Pleurochrysis_carterae.AAC.1